MPNSPRRQFKFPLLIYVAKYIAIRYVVILVIIFHMSVVTPQNKQLQSVYRSINGIESQSFISSAGSSDMHRSH